MATINLYRADVLLDTFFSQPIPWLAIALALLSAFLMGFGRSGLGTGGFIASPLMVFAIGAVNGVAVVALLMLPAAVLGVWQHRAQARRDLLVPLLPSAVIGTGIGALILWGLVSSGAEPEVHRRLELVVALLCLVYGLLLVFRDRLAHLGGGAEAPRPQGLVLMGSAVGISQTVSNTGSPLMTLYFLRHRLNRDIFVPAQLGYMLVQNILKLIPLISLGLLTPVNATAGFILIPVTLAGSLSGKRFFQQASETQFFRLYVLLLLLGFAVSLSLLIGRRHILHLLGSGL